jgi:signal transduction histidine kinase
MSAATSRHHRSRDANPGNDADPTPPHSVVGTSVVDGEGRFLWADSTTTRLLGISAVRLEASRLGAFVDHDDLQAELLAMHRLRKGDTSYELEQRWVGPTGTRRHVLVRGHLLWLPGAAGRRAAATGLFVRQAVDRDDLEARGKGSAFDDQRAHDTGSSQVLDLIGCHDQSQRVELAELELRAEQLERSNRDLSEFAYVAAHDLRAPLAALAGSAELLARCSGSQLDVGAQRYLAAVLAKVGTMGRMIDDILAYCHAGGAGEARQVVNCTDIVAEVLEYLAPQIVEAEAYVSLQSLGKVAGERTQLVQLFQNLVSNALKYRRPGCRARIDISVRRVGNDQVFAVADAGIGVSDENRADIFRMFHQLNERSGPSGSGIGLAICKRIVERHGGRIWVDDSPEGGLCVSFSLPAAYSSPPD